MEAGRKALEFGRKALDAYKKTLLIDKVTLNDERPPPVYLLDEISDILRSCSLDLTQEIVEYTFRRLRHPSSQVKYKVLRFIKYTVNRAGSAAYRKELQSYAASIRELFNFQGQVDPVKGNALIQAVRDAAHEAIKAIFSSDASLATSNSISNRIEGFGNCSFSKSYVSSYGTTGIVDKARDSFQPYDGNGHYDSITWNQEREVEEDMEDKPSWQSPRRNFGHENFHAQSRKAFFPEEKLLDQVTDSQGLRLQPSHESLQSFLSSAKTLDAIKIAYALKAKLQSPSWKVRLKALCVLQALVLQKDGSLLQAIEADEGGFQGCVQECLLSSQTTLRKKAKEALDVLLALKKAKHCKGSPSVLAGEASPTIKTCDKPFFVIESNQEDSRDTNLSGPSPKTTSDTPQQVVDFLSFQTDGFAQVRAAETSPNSVMYDPFDGMYIHGSHESAGLYVEDLLSGDWTYDSANDEKAPFRNWANEQSSILLSATTQSDATKQSQHRLDNLPMSDFMAKSSTPTGKIATSSLDSKIFLAQSPGNIPAFQNLNALHMFPTGMTGPARNIVALQQCPGNVQGFDFGLNNAAIGFSEKSAVGRHGLADAYFKDFGLSS